MQEDEDVCQVIKMPRVYRYVLNSLTICLIISLLGGGLVFLGHSTVGKIMVGVGIVSGNLCILTLAIVKLVRVLKGKKDED